MNQNSNAIITLCSHLCVGEGIVPLAPKEWSDLAAKLMQLGLQPKALFDLPREALIETLKLSEETAERVARLIGRNASLSFQLSEYENIGITVVTRADPPYPGKLKKVLGNHCPPLFYCAGDMALLNRSYIGYVGSRTASEDDIAFTKATVQKTATQGYGVVSGGAKGIDTVAAEEALSHGAPAVEYLSDSMLQKMKKVQPSSRPRGKAAAALRCQAGCSFQRRHGNDAQPLCVCAILRNGRGALGIQ